MKEKLSKYLVLFITFLKVGLFTFGGGYAMIPLIQSEVAEKKKWIRESELIDIITISESTPGPIAVNAATYIGYRVAGFWGAFFSTLGLIIPSFVIILLISFIYDKISSFTVIQNMFKGIKVGVTLLLVTAIIKLSKGIKKGWYFYTVFLIGLAISICFSIWLSNFSYIALILIALGLILGIIKTKIEGGKDK